MALCVYQKTTATRCFPSIRSGFSARRAIRPFPVWPLTPVHAFSIRMPHLSLLQFPPMYLRSCCFASRTCSELPRLPSCRAQSRSASAWAGARATAGVVSGCHYWEATVRDEGLVRVGWSTRTASLELGTDKQACATCLLLPRCRFPTRLPMIPAQTPDSAPVFPRPRGSATAAPEANQTRSLKRTGGYLGGATSLVRDWHWTHALTDLLLRVASCLHLSCSPRNPRAFVRRTCGVGKKHSHAT